MHTVVTHGGSFHADDVFALAALGLYLGPEHMNIVRTRDEAVIASGDWVIDVGGVYDSAKRRFDHHQNGAPIRENGIPYAAFGLIWKEIGTQVAGSPETAAIIEERFVLPIDAGDNGIGLYTLNEQGIAPFAIHDLVNSFRPVWQTEERADAQFAEVVLIARTFLRRAIAHANATRKMRALADEVYAHAADKRVLVFSVPMSSELCIDHPDVSVVVCPDDPKVSSNWNATAVRKSRDTFALRVAFPEAWAGLRAEALQKASGIPDAVFCHKNRFLFVAASKEGVCAAVAKALEQ